MRFVKILAASTLLLAGAGLAVAASPQEKLDKILAGRVAGAPVSCISLPSVRNTQVIDGTAIVYEAGGTIYVNRPESGARSLSDNYYLSTTVHGSQLCDVDIVRLKDRLTRIDHGFVNLGAFVPYTKAK